MPCSGAVLPFLLHVRIDILQTTCAAQCTQPTCIMHLTSDLKFFVYHHIYDQWITPECDTKATKQRSPVPNVKNTQTDKAHLLKMHLGTDWQTNGTKRLSRSTRLKVPSSSAPCLREKKSTNPNSWVCPCEVRRLSHRNVLSTGFTSNSIRTSLQPIDAPLRQQALSPGWPWVSQSSPVSGLTVHHVAKTSQAAIFSIRHFDFSPGPPLSFHRDLAQCSFWKHLSSQLFAASFTLPMISSRCQQLGFPMQSGWTVPLHTALLLPSTSEATGCIRAEPGKSLAHSTHCGPAHLWKTTEPKTNMLRPEMLSTQDRTVDFDLQCSSVLSLPPFFVSFLSQTWSILLCPLLSRSPWPSSKRPSQSCSMFCSSMLLLWAARPFPLSPLFSCRWIPRQLVPFHSLLKFSSCRLFLSSRSKTYNQALKQFVNSVFVPLSVLVTDRSSATAPLRMLMVFGCSRMCCKSFYMCFRSFQIQLWCCRHLVFQGDVQRDNLQF